MKTKLIAQEILIVYSSTLFKREFDVKNDTHPGHSTSHERLADVCRQCLLSEIIPENFPKLSLQEINETFTFIELKYGDFDSSFDHNLSINPYIFLKDKSEN